MAGSRDESGSEFRTEVSAAPRSSARSSTRYDLIPDMSWEVNRHTVRHTGVHGPTALAEGHRVRDQHFCMSHYLGKDFTFYLWPLVCCNYHHAVQYVGKLLSLLFIWRAYWWFGSRWTGTACNALARCPWSCSFDWCSAEGWRIGDQCRHVSRVAWKRL